jgi:hypothetical protein
VDEQQPPKSSNKELAWLALAVTLFLVILFLLFGGTWLRFFPSA